MRVLVVLGTTVLYGMERAVLDVFQDLRPAVEPHFLLSRTAVNTHRPLFREIEERELEWSRFSDHWSWPMLGRPQSMAHLVQMLAALALGNLDVLRASRGRDAIYVPNVFFLLYALVACCLFRLTGRRVVYEFHNVLDGVSPYSYLLRALHRVVTDFVHGSEYSLAWMRAHQPYIPDEKVTVIPRTVRPPDQRGEKPLSGYAAKRNIVFLGQVSAPKGPDVLVRAFSVVADEAPNAHLHLVGGCDASFDRDLRRLIADLGVTERVTLWGFQRQAARFLTGADVFVQPTFPHLHRETAPLAVLEAMAAGVPAIVFPSGALCENVLHEQTGLVCEAATVESLASALRRMLFDRGLRDRCAVGARRRYELRHAPDRTRQGWLSLFGLSRSAAPQDIGTKDDVTIPSA